MHPATAASSPTNWFGVDVESCRRRTNRWRACRWQLPFGQYAEQWLRP
ncbi:hypothetical protein [Micromonospora qiuiae]|nr:hypothetical protein [Micromonospora qiuiae]